MLVFIWLLICCGFMDRWILFGWLIFMKRDRIWCGCCLIGCMKVWGLGVFLLCRMVLRLCVG